MQQEFTHLRNAALQGTARPGAHHPFPVLLEDEQEATRLLHAIALLTTAKKAGTRTLPDTELALPDPIIEDQPYCTTKAVDLWHQIEVLESKYPVFEAQWLDLCAQRGQVIAPQMITSLLSMGAQKKMAHLRPAIRKVLGKRGQWIAGFNEKWRFGIATDFTAVWQNGKPAERLEALRMLRAEHPELSRTLVAATWAKESAADRKKIVEILPAGLSDADEPFLLALLESLPRQTVQPKANIQEIKQAIVQMLLALPGSTWYARWVSLLKPLFKSGNIRLPETDEACFDPVWLVGENGFMQEKFMVIWWRSMLSFLPPAIWCAASGLPAEAVLPILENRAHDPESSPERVRILLTRAAVFYQDSGWAALLLPKAPPSDIADLFGVLAAAERESVIMSNQFPTTTTLSLLSSAMHLDWSLTFSNWVLRELYQSWIGYYFSKVQQIMPLDVFLHPKCNPASIPELYDSADKRDRWLQTIAPELEKALVVKRILANYTPSAL